MRRTSDTSPRGIAGAKAAGMVAVGFRNPRSGDHDLSQADLVVDSFAETETKRIIALVPG